MDIGATLREARERRGLSLETVSLRTKIRIDLLRALEGSAFERLPEGIFVRGFVRAYAREVGLDPAEAVSWYQAELGDNGAGMGRGPDAGTGVGALEPVSTPVPIPAAEPSSPTDLRPWVIAAAVLVPLAFYLLALPLLRTPSVPHPAAASGVQPGAAQVAPSEPPTAPVATTGKPLQVQIEVQRRCWVSATADGQRAVYRTMVPGEREAIVVVNDLSLRLGDAGALTYSIDGATGRSLGRSGQPLTVRMTRDNYREFLVKERQVAR